MLYSIAYLFAGLTLAAWFVFQKNKRAERYLQYTFLIAFVFLLFSIFTAEAASGYKFKIATRDLISLGVIGLIFQFLKGHKLVSRLALAILAIGLFWYQSSVLESTFPQMADVPLSPDGELLVDLREGQEGSALAPIANRFGLTYAPAFSPARPEITQLDDYYVIDIPDDMRRKLSAIKKALRRSGIIDWVEENESVQVSPLPGETPGDINARFGINDPGLEKLWGFERMEVDQLYDLLKEKEINPAEKALIAILDTGVDANHEDIADNFRSLQTKYDNDPRGHGTHCAGIAAAVSNNGMGVASFSHNNAFVEVTSIKVLNAYGSGTQRTIINGIIEAADAGASVISLSLGGRSSDKKQRAYEEAVAYANKAGAIVVAAAGNAGRNARDFAPVSARGVIGVSAIDEELKLASFSNVVKDIEMGIAAPGVNIYSTIPKDQYTSFNGTSMATPYVAGLVGLLKSLRPELNTEEVYDLLHNTGQKTGSGKDSGQLIQPEMAVRKLLDE